MIKHMMIVDILGDAGVDGGGVADGGGSGVGAAGTFGVEGLAVVSADQTAAARGIFGGSGVRGGAEVGLVRRGGGMRGDVLRGAGGTDHAGVERGAARTADAVDARGLSGGEQAGDIGAPPEVDGKAAVVMLRAEGDLERLARKNPYQSL